MAFSKSLVKGQIPVCCELCESDTKIHSKCMECELMMCSKCKDRVHPKFKNAKDHRIVDIKDVGHDTAATDHQEMNFTNIKCKEHSGQFSCMFCKSCDQLVCPLCISEVHNGHGLVEIKEGYDIQIRKLAPIEIQVIKDLDEVRDKEQKIEKVKETENAKYQDSKKRILEQNSFLKKNVDEYTNNLLKNLDQKWEGFEMANLKQQQRVTKLTKDLTEKMSIMKTLRESHDTEKIFSETKNISKLITCNQESIDLTIESMPVFIPGEIIISQYNFGQLQQSPSTAITIDVTTCFSTNLGIVSHISVNPNNSLWINNTKLDLLQNVKPEGDNHLTRLSSYNIKVYGMALTPSNDILLATMKSSLQMISKSSGEIVDTKYTIPSLNCIAVHVTGDNKVIIGAMNRLVIIMDLEGKHEITFEHDKNGEILFSYPRQITSTRNRNIFVIDDIFDDSKGRVVILQQTGDVVNIYKGHPNINDDKRLFKPTRMTCTALDNIIVTDLDLNIIHILNNTGYLIKYYNMKDIGILRAYSLAFSRSGKLYIGCSRKLGSKTNNAKLYEVNISGI